MTTSDTTPEFRAARAKARSAFQDLLGHPCLMDDCQDCERLIDTYLMAEKRMNELRPAPAMAAV